MSGLLLILLGGLLLAMTGCDGSASSGTAPGSAASVSAAPATMPAGMSRYAYFCCDGGPHMLLPVEAQGSWKAIDSPAEVTNPNSDYGRACAATTTLPVNALQVGSSAALIFQGPPMSAWGVSADELVEIYVLHSWKQTNLDDLIGRATAATPTAAMPSTGLTFRLKESGALLFFAGDSPRGEAYGVQKVPIRPGDYDVLHGTFSDGGEKVEIYRLKPKPASKESK